MKKPTRFIPFAVLCVCLLVPTVASAHDWTDADGAAVNAMGYRAWANAHNAAAPGDLVPVCIPASSPATSQPALEGTNRCSAAEDYARVQAAYQQAQANSAALQAYAAALNAYANASSRRYDSPSNPSTITVNGTGYTCWNFGYGSYSNWDCNS